MKKIIALFLGISAFTLGAQSIERSVIGCTGGSFSNGTVSADWTVGEVVTSTATGGSTILTQGFQQPPSGNVSVSQVKPIQGLSCYPNPTENLVNLNWLGKQASAVVQLYDASGRLVYTSNWTDMTPFQIDLSSFAPGLYSLQVVSGDLSSVMRVVKL